MPSFFRAPATIDYGRLGDNDRLVDGRACARGLRKVVSRNPEIPSQDHAHVACVGQWGARIGTGLASKDLLLAFEDAFGALWRRALRTLGEITLVAIAGRTLYSTSEEFPLFASLRLDGSGLRCEELEKRIESVDRDELAKGIERALVEFLTVIGNLTAEVLTPALHLELSNVAARAADPGAAKLADRTKAQS
jgi:hypothetical protein